MRAAESKIVTETGTEDSAEEKLDRKYAADEPAAPAPVENRS